MNEPDFTVDTARLAQLADDSGIPVGELIIMWVTDTADQLDAAARAFEAGNVREGLRLVHGMAGATALFGFSTLAAQLLAIEQLAADGRGDDALGALPAARQEFRRLSAALPRDRA